MLAMLGVGCKRWGENSTNSKKKVKVSPKTPILDPNKEHVIFPKERMDRYSIPQKMNGG
jgi:hypothetical protein